MFTDKLGYPAWQYHTYLSASHDALYYNVPTPTKVEGLDIGLLLKGSILSSGANMCTSKE
jgi:hypothetical protein